MQQTVRFYTSLLPVFAGLEDDGVRGGIPAVPDLVFDLDDPDTVDAMNDLGCRAYQRMGIADFPFTRTMFSRSPVLGPFAFVERESEIQFAIPIARAWALPDGDTIFAVRVRDVVGTFSEVHEIVVRVGD